jgi:putative flippase GtrA
MLKNKKILFLFGGLLNTALTYAIYLLLNSYMYYLFAYFISYIMGIIFAYYYNSKYVFNVSFSWKKLFQYPVIYIIQYIVSTLLLIIFVSIIQIDESIAPLIILSVMVPFSYLLNEFILNHAPDLKVGLNQPTISKQHDRVGGMEPLDAAKLRELEAENNKLKT